MTVLGDDGDLADAPLDGAVVLGLVHRRAVGVAGRVVFDRGVGKVFVNREGGVAPLGVVDQDRAHGARVVGVSRDTCDVVTAGRCVEGDYTAAG